MNDPQSTPYARLGRRLAAGVYDALPIAALWFLVGMLAVALNRGEAVAGFSRHLLFAGLLGVTLAYLAVSWRRGGQTIGMRAWRLKMIAVNAPRLGWWRAILRAALGLLQVLPLGLGLIPVLIDRERRSLADRLCETRVLHLPR